MKIQLDKNFADIVSVENLLLAWQEFVRGKLGKRDVQAFSLRLMDNILTLHDDLQRKTYVHGGYEHFRISDPKPRDIHKATVRDRVLHHTIYRILYPFFNRTLQKEWLESLIPQIHEFLERKFQLILHPDKVFIKTFASGVDFLGWVHFSDHRVLRTASKRRMFRRIEGIEERVSYVVMQSYLGLLQHGNTQSIRKDLLKYLPIGKYFSN